MSPWLSYLYKAGATNNSLENMDTWLPNLKIIFPWMLMNSVFLVSNDTKLMRYGGGIFE